MAYSRERKASVIAKMLPPHNLSLRQLSREEGISEGTLSRWRAEARAQGKLLPDGQSGPKGWTARDKFAVVVETAALNEAELSEYCRKRGLYPEQIQTWRAACERANDWEQAASRQIAKETKGDKKRIRELERELLRKEKALAETAALMVLRKKANAIWGQSEGEDE
ncbi:transposase [Celeribacter halophilus]|uniref:transposase n=1 Tax=Celeribacter halophilus TaxID=576117 RepID=UPI00083035EA|nr:transposase [Celeribacter halophilus]